MAKSNRSDSSSSDSSSDSSTLGGHDNGGFEGEDIDTTVEFDEKDGNDMKDVKINVFENRPAYKEKDFHEEYPAQNKERPGIVEREYKNAKRGIKSMTCRKFLKMLRGKVPIINVIQNYNWKEDILSDIVAGLTVGIMQIPQGMGYAMLANIPLINGIYMSFFPVLIYGLLGTSPHISMGCYAIQCIMLGANVQKYPDYDPVGVATVLAFWSGIYLTAIGLLQLSSLMVFFSDMLTSGFTWGAAFHVFTSQVPSLLGIKIKSEGGALQIIYDYIEIFKHIKDSNTSTLVVSAIAVVVMVVNNEFLKPWVAKRSPVPIPMELLLVISGTAASYCLDFEGRWGIFVVGDIKAGIPGPKLPEFSYMGEMAVDGLVTGIVGFVSTFSLAKLFAMKKGTIIDPQQECYALGLANFFGSFFRCGPSSSSLSRASVQVNAGARTTLTPLISCILLVFVLLWLGPLFETLPNCVLAAIITVSLKGMFLHIYDFVDACKTSKTDAVMWIVPAVTVIILNIDYGLYCGVGVAVIILIYRAQRPPAMLLGRLPGTQVYVDVYEYPAAEEMPGVKVFQMNGGLYFATREYFQNELFHLVGINPRKYLVKINKHERKRKAGKYIPEDKPPPLQHLVLDMTHVGSIDVDGCKVVVSTAKEFEKIGVKVYLVTGAGHTCSKLERFGVKDKIESEKIYPTLLDCLQHLEKFYGETDFDTHI